jgi:hypothetical protein
MVNKKLFLKIVLLSISFCFVFFAGFYIGYEIVWPKKNTYPGALQMIRFFNAEIEENFGVMTQYDKEYEVVGGINWKDWTFSIIIEDGVKTIRSYKYISDDK